MYQKYNAQMNELDNVNMSIQSNRTYINQTIRTTVDILRNKEYLRNEEMMQSNGNIAYNCTPNPVLCLTPKGCISIYIREAPCLLVTELLVQHHLHRRDIREIVGVLSCFTSIRLSDDERLHAPKSRRPCVNDIVICLMSLCDEYQAIETDNILNTGTDYSIQFDIIDVMMDWCDCSTEVECRRLIDGLRESQIFLGEFIKAVLKVVKICGELESVAEYMGDMEFLQKMKGVPSLMLKFVVTNQSLYV
jgi:superfamily II RNA helicase